MKNRHFIISTSLFIISLNLRVTIENHYFMIFSTLFVATSFTLQALKNLRYHIIGIDLLVSLAMVGALIIGEYWEAAAVSYLFYLGAYLESRALATTRSTIRSLIKEIPNDESVLVEGLEVIKPLEEVMIDDHVLVKPGTMIPVDGVIIEGNASINEASINGESLPVDKAVAMHVFAGTMIEAGHLVIAVNKKGNDTVYAGIVQLVEQAQDEKTEAQKMIDSFAQYYTPLIILLSIASYLFTRDIYVSLTLLVVACPGALVIATPITLVSGIGRAAKRGVLIKSSQVLEDFSKTEIFAFDKTGTLTQGIPEIVDVIEVSKSRGEILHLAAIGERYSEHPIAKAILREFDDFNEKASYYDMIPGKGIHFTYNNHEMKIGNATLFENLEFKVPDRVGTQVILGDDFEIYGIIVLSDAIRPNAGEVIKTLSKPSMILSGDHVLAAKEVAQKLGIETVHANLQPIDKAQIVGSIPHLTMVGDGINDAPALARATVGVSIGGTTNTVAMDTSDIILMNANIASLPFAFSLAKKTMTIMKQNIAIAILTSILLIGGVLGSRVSLSIGMFVHEITIFVVIANALRLLRMKG